MSHCGLGAVLSLEYNAKVGPVAFASRGLRTTEKNIINYSSMKAQCVVYTYNNPLCHVEMTKLGAMVHSWSSRLPSFTHQFCYHQGSNRNADVLLWQYKEYKGITGQLSSADEDKVEVFSGVLAPPGAREKAQLSKDSQELFHQWSRMGERDAMLY